MRTLTDEDLMRYVDNDCSPQERLDFERIIDSNPNLKIKLDQIRFTDSSARSSGLESVSPGFTQKVIAELGGQETASRAFDFKPLRFMLILLGLIVAAAVVGAEITFETDALPYFPAGAMEAVFTTINTVGASEYFRNFALIIVGLLTLFLLDMVVLKRLFHPNGRNAPA